MLSHDEAPTSTAVIASQAIAEHTLCVREWLSAPMHERGYYATRVDAAWRAVRASGVTSQASTAATCLLRFNGKLKGHR